MNKYNRKNKIGNKGKNLFILKENKFNVPEFIVIDNDKINLILYKEIKINNELVNNFFDFGNNSNLIFIEKIHSKIDSWNPSQLFIKSLKEELLKFRNKKLILRSSNDCEDNSNNSFAGIFESKITSSNIIEIIKTIKIILKGNFSKRLYYYLQIKKINIFPNLSIIVQEYINGDISGVLFIEKNKFHINYNKGNAKTIVDGVNCESYSDFKLEEKIKYLNKIQLRKLKKISLKIQNLFNDNQDIEWTFKNNKLYILQTRPITKNLNKENIIWDNSNISESYSGIVLPLTCSYASYIYKEVYINLAKSSAISDKKIKENYEIFENLLGFFYGRFYYNMTNWYKMLTLYPGYKRNKKNFDLMISKKTQNDLNQHYKKNVSLIFAIKYYFKLLYRAPLFSTEVKKFKYKVKNYYKKISKKDLQNLDINELLDFYYEFRKELLLNWHITVESDFLAMTYYGYLKKFSEKNNIEKSKLITLISNMSNVISAKQINFLTNLSVEFKKYSKLMDLANKNEFLNCFTEIKINKEYSKLNKRLNKYFEIYGGRFANELKLESENLDENPEYIIKLLFLYSKNKTNKQLKTSKTNEELINKLKFNFFKKLILKYLVNKTKYYFREREEMRLLRSTSFSKIRDIFLGMGKEFEKNNLISNKRDIFYLKINEILDYVEGKTIDNSFKKIIKVRKEEYKNYENIELENSFETHFMPHIEIEKIIKYSKFKNKKTIFGTPCSKGIIQGKITVLNEFRLPKKNEIFEIVVVKNTDPGWTPLFGLCKGLIVEQGGILSHASIVSRELGLPSIIGINNITKILKTGDIVTLNAITGEIKIEK